MLTAYDVHLLREFELWLCFADDAGTDWEQRTYLMWDLTEVAGRYLTLRGEGENTKFVELG